MTPELLMWTGRGAGLNRALLAVLAALLVAPICRSQPARESPIDAWANGRLNEILAAADSEESPDFDRVNAELSIVFDALIAYGDERRPQALVEAAKWRRLARFVPQTQTRHRAAFWRTLRENPQFAGHLAFALREEDDASGMSRIAAGLAQAAAANPDMIGGERRRPGRGGNSVDPAAGLLDPVGPLAAALCVVHDEPLERRINENNARAPDPVALFRYYLENERSLLFNFRNMPVDVLVYVVDVTGSIDELEWALRKHRGERRIGATYHDINYDYQHFRNGTEKKVTQAGFTLPNIAQHGGVCADQAYYAMTCGKAIGVPTAYVVARSAEVAHAWVGFVEGRQSRAEWNFEYGRYDAYKGVKGRVEDPQRRKGISDGDLAFLAESMTEPVEQRWAAAALTDAAERLLELEGSREAYPPPFPLKVETSRDLPRTRPATLADALHLLETGLRQTPGYRRGWEVIRELAAEGRLTYEQKQEWARVLDRLAGARYPDFTLSVLQPMIETIEDPKQQHELWERAIAICGNRPDLIAEIRMAQGKLWETQNEKAKAWECYQDVIRRYLNDGPFAFDALRAAERMLRVSGKRDQVAPLYEDAWKRVRPPQQMAEQFMVQSNYFRIGARYAELLEEAGRANLASSVRGKIGLLGNKRDQGG